jgi:hypothetical protein
LAYVFRYRLAEGKDSLILFFVASNHQTLLPVTRCRGRKYRVTVNADGLCGGERRGFLIMRCQERSGSFLEEST